MARQEKSTRARGLPPRVLLSQRQDATGSFPTVWRTSSDNRTGRYNVSFNDNKVVPFNQYEAADYDSNFLIKAASDVAAGVQYVEKVENDVYVPAGGSKTVSFSQPFTDKPFVVITELSSANSLQNVNAFLAGTVNQNEFTVKFSSEFQGSFVYRAVYEPAPETLRIVERKPRYPNAFARFTATSVALINNNSVDITFNNFGDDTAENFVTFYDNNGNGQADIWPNITTQTRTLVALTASSIATATVEYERFHGLHNRGIIYPLGMNQATILAGLSQENQIEMYGSVSFISGAVVNQPTKWIVASGSMKKNIADTFITFTPGQDIQSFRDNNNPAVDGKISSSVNGINPFYATGSAVDVTGQGFQQPLWSKSKIEISLDVATPATFGQSTYNNQDKLMSYYDFAQKTYVPIGDPRGNHQLLTASVTNLEYFASKSIGFSTSTYGYFSLGASAITSAKILATPVNSFGFPYDVKRYGVVTNSRTGALNTNENMLLNIGNYISEPFLLEKIVLEFTGAMSSSGTDESGASAMSTFFILNQTNTTLVKPEQTYTALQAALFPPYTPGLESTGSGFTDTISHGSTGLDLVTYCQIAALTSSLLNEFASVNDLFARDLNIYQEAQAPVANSYGLNPNFGYSGSFVISASVRSPTALAYSSVFRSWTVLSGAPTNYIVSWQWLDNRYGGRKSLLEPSGRNWKQFIAPQNPAESITLLGFTFPTQDKTHQENPYILLPSDKLIFGWQCPLSDVSGSALGNVGDLAKLHFPVGFGKITLYGSSLRVNPETNQLEEHHDTLNQLLSSESIHEVIG